jgi:hypothetical protein
LRDDAIAALQPLGKSAIVLADLAHFVVSRVT